MNRMKKLLSLVLMAAVVLVVAGCDKPADGGAAPGGTNAPAAK